MNSEMPTKPSNPTTAISADAPLSVTYSKDTMEVVGKYTCDSTDPDSYSTCPKGISTASRCGNQCWYSASGKDASRWFWRGSLAALVRDLEGIKKESLVGVDAQMRCA